MNYNPYPLGRIKPEHQRTEPELLKEKGYLWNDPRDIIEIFEKKVASHFGSNYAVSTDCCSSAIFLSLQYLLKTGWLIKGSTVTIPNNTYISVPMQIIHAGLKCEFKDCQWQGFYQLEGTNIVDASVLWQKGAYHKHSLMCLSFQIKKNIPVGKMGAILTDSLSAYNWLKLASYDGRDLKTPYDSPSHVKMLGWHCYATPEDCARAILLMDEIPDRGAYLGSQNYPDAKKMLETILKK